MTSDAKALDSIWVTFAACIMCVAGAAGFLVMPVLITAVVGQFSLSEEQAGFFASAVMAGSALSSLLAIFWVRKFDWRLSGIATGCCLLLGHAAALSATDASTFMMAQVIAAFGGGSMYSLALTVLSDGSNPERGFGVSIASQVAFQVAGMMLLPEVIAESGLSTVIQLFLALTVAAALLVLVLPRSGLPVSDNHSLHAVFSPVSLFALLGCLFFFFNVGAFWSYIELLAVDRGLSAESIGTGLAVGVSFGLPGALLASYLGERFGIVLPLAFGAAGTVISAVMLTVDFAGVEFLIALAIYNVVWNFSLTYQYAAVAKVDTTGSSVAVAPAFHGVGAAIGPSVAGMLFADLGYTAVTLLAGLAAVISLLMFYVSFQLTKRESVLA